MKFYFYLCCFILIIFHSTSDAFMKLNSFNGTLTVDYLFQVGYTFQSKEIILNNAGIKSIAPYTFYNFTN